VVVALDVGDGSRLFIGEVEAVSLPLNFTVVAHRSCSEFDHHRSALSASRSIFFHDLRQVLQRLVGHNVIFAECGTQSSRRMRMARNARHSQHLCPPPQPYLPPIAAPPTGGGLPHLEDGDNRKCVTSAGGT
jgi:hypothetical protein